MRIGPPPHAFGPIWKRCAHADVTAEVSPDFNCAPSRSIRSALVLRGVDEAIAMPAEKIAPRPMQLGNAPSADNSVHRTRADEIRSRATEPAGHADDPDGLIHVLAIGHPRCAPDTRASIGRPGRVERPSRHHRPIPESQSKQRQSSQICEAGRCRSRDSFQLFCVSKPVCPIPNRPSRPHFTKSSEKYSRLYSLGRLTRELFLHFRRDKLAGMNASE